MSSCVSCNKELLGGAKFCRYCGSNQAKLKNEVAQEITLSCPACGIPIAIGAKFCRSCGALVSTVSNTQTVITSEYLLAEEIKTLTPHELTTETQDLKNKDVESENVNNNFSITPLNVQKDKNKKPILVLFLLVILIVGFLFFILGYEKISAVFFNSTNNSVKVLPSFDCKKARSTNEKLICSDNQLAKADNEFNEIFQLVKAKVGNSSEFKSDAVAALKQRESNCTDKKCLLDWYANRKVFYQDIINEAEENCQYFLGEVPYDKERETFLLENIEKFCPLGTKPSWK